MKSLGQPARPTRRVAWGALLALVLLGLSFLGWRGCSAGRWLVAGDGRAIRLQGATYGKQHFPPPQGWNRLCSHLPEDVASRLAIDRGLNQVTAGDALVLWMEGRPPVLEASEMARAMWWLYRYAWVEDDGSETPLFPPFFPLGAREDGTLLAAQVEVFPRRERRLRLAVRDFSSGESVGQIDSRNPAFGVFPDWEPDALPARAESGGVTFELTDFRVERAEAPGRASRARAMLRAGAAGRLLEGWRVWQYALEDPTGNRIRSPHVLEILHSMNWISRGTDEGLTELAFDWPGWRSEPVWRLELTMVPMRAEGMGPGDSVEVLRGLTVPARDGVTRVERDVELGHYTVHVLGLVGDHTYWPGRLHDVHEMTTLELEMPELRLGDRFRVMQVAGDGADLTTGVVTVGAGSIGFRVPDGVKSLDITLAVFRERVVTFSVSR